MKMKETRQYKQTELGLLPEDWEVAKLGDIGELAMCKRIFQNETSDMGDVPFYKIGTFGKTADAYISYAKYNEFKTEFRFPNKGDILISAAGTIGRIVVYDGKPAYFQDSNIVWLAHSGKTIRNDYLFYVYQITDWNTENTTIARLYNDNFNKTIIPLPPIEEQRRIASALTSIDNLIDSLDKLIAKKRDIKQGAMQQLLSGKKRLKGFTDKWETLLFKDIFTFLTTNTFAREVLNIKGEIKNIHYGDILTNYSEILDVSKTDLPYIDSNKVTRYNPVILAQDGDIIIADTAEDETVCKATEIYNIGNAKVVSGLHTMWCRPKNNIFAPKFLGYFINSSMFHDQILPLIQGIKVSSVSKNAIKHTWISFPTISEQQAISSVLTSMDNELSALEAKRKKYEQIKQGMMQQLLTGKIRLENASTVH